MTSVAHSSTLALSERTRLAQLEETIERGLATFVEVGAALMEVRDSRLYRDGFTTFEDYCRERWQMARNYANKLIAASEAVANLGTTVPILPITESQARPLTRLEPDQRRAAWTEAIETAPRNEAGEPQVTAAHVENVVREVEGRPKMAVHYSSDTPEWHTPRSIIDAVVALFGEIDLDPCSNPGKPNVPAHEHLTAKDDGFSRIWMGRVYMNPPYGDEIGNWTAKLRNEYEAGSVIEAVALLPARTDTRWFRELRQYPRCFVSGRLKFSESETSAPFPSAVVYFGPRVEEFARAFTGIGDTYALYAPV